MVHIAEVGLVTTLYHVPLGIIALLVLPISMNIPALLVLIEVLKALGWHLSVLNANGVIIAQLVLLAKLHVQKVLSTPKTDHMLSIIVRHARQAKLALALG